jgi:hypothetical protein
LPLSILIVGVGNADFKQMEVEQNFRNLHYWQIQNILNMSLSSLPWSNTMHIYSMLDAKSLYW